MQQMVAEKEMEADLNRASNNDGERHTVTILGIRIDRIDMAHAIKRVEGFLKGSRPHLIVTADAAGVVIAKHDDELRRIMLTADLVTPDSSGILLGAKLQGTPLIERVSGVDLAQEICGLCARTEHSVFLLGAAPGVAQAAATMLQNKYPGLRVAGVHDGFFSDDKPVVEMIRSSGTDVLFVAMGIPKQEKWIARWIGELGVRAAIGVGGSFDVFSGNVQRAPQWMRDHGLEWLHRVAINPRKMSKVAHLPKFALMVLRERLTPRRGR